MNIDRFKHQHVEILSGIHVLRQLSHQGVADHAAEIADALAALAQVVTQHLAIEDRILYPAVESSGNDRLARMSASYQSDMKGIANAFIHFARRWGNAALLRRCPDDFRAAANMVLKNVHLRMVRENREFYPAIETL